MTARTATGLEPSSAQPQLAQRESHSSLRPISQPATCPAVAAEGALNGAVEDQESTPRPYHQTIGPRCSSETLKAKASNTASSNAGSASSSSTAASKDNNHTMNVYSDNKNGDDNNNDLKSKVTAKSTPTPTHTSTTSKFTLGIRSKKKSKKKQRQEQEREEQLRKDQAAEAMRRKHGEYHPPGQHSQGQIYTHRPQQHHDHHSLERSRSRSAHNMRGQYQRNSSSASVRIASPTPKSRPTSPTSVSYSPSPSPTPSSSSSAYSSRHNNYNRGRHGRPASHIMRDIVHIHPHMNDLEGLDADGILSKHWDSSSSSDDDHGRRNNGERDSNGYGREENHHRKTSVGTSSSCRTSASSSMVRFNDRPHSPSSSVASSHLSRHGDGHSRNRSAISIDIPPNFPSISQQIRPDSQQEHHHRRHSIEIQEVGNADQSWPPLNHINASTTGIVTGLDPEYDMPRRPHSSQGRYRPHTPNGRNPIVERYLYPSRAISPTGSNHRPHSRQRQHDQQYQKENGASSDMTSTAATATAAVEVARSKAGSRAAGTFRADTWSVRDGTEAAEDEHNYLAPLPPFQRGPAYTRVPKRKFCKCCFGGCRWWVLLLSIAIPAAVVAVVAIILLHRFQACVAIDPNTVDAMVYTVDPALVEGIVLQYNTRTKGTLNIIDSPDKNETRVLLKLQRKFHNMKNRQDLAGLQVETLPNGYSRYILNDDVENLRGFLEPTVLCSQSILTIEMPMAALGRREIALDAMIDQQDVLINLNETMPRNTSWTFRGSSDRTMLVQSLNINALSISYTSSTPATVILRSVIVRDQLSVVSVSGDIQAAVGFSTPSPLPFNSSTNTTTPLPSSLSPSTVNLNTFDGQIQFDLKPWNQSCTFQVDSPSVQISKSGVVVLPFDRRNSTSVDTNGLIANTGYNSVSGNFRPPGAVAGPGTGLPTPPNNITATSLPFTASATATVRATSTRRSTMTVTSGTRTATLSGTIPSMPTATTFPPAGPTLGAGSSALPAQLLIHANKNVILNFP
ncbi:hypothetical protein BGX28_008138 [Mortierella sp. GBA30]|nr:hypothetical protein BGX28_008138 [Mortierella sp. GBA30]